MKKILILSLLCITFLSVISHGMDEYLIDFEIKNVPKELQNKIYLDQKYQDLILDKKLGFDDYMRSLKQEEIISPKRVITEKGLKSKEWVTVMVAHCVNEIYKENIKPFFEPKWNDLINWYALLASEKISKYINLKKSTADLAISSELINVIEPSVTTYMKNLSLTEYYHIESQLVDLEMEQEAEYEECSQELEQFLKKNPL